ncbi:MAG: PrgI family protein [Patescibacteria group bacterium]
MMQFVVPQFIDVEDKILGPFTVRQFILILFWGIMSFLQLKIFSMLTFIFLFIFWSGFMFLLAFVKINGRPFHYFILSILQTTRLPKLRLWHKEDTEYEYRFAAPPAAKPKAPMATKQALTASRLTELSLVVDTGGAYTEEGDIVAGSLKQ